MTNPIPIKESEIGLKILLTKKIPGFSGFIGEPNVKGELLPIQLGILPNSFYDANFTLILKPKTLQKKTNTNFPHAIAPEIFSRI